LENHPKIKKIPTGGFSGLMFDGRAKSGAYKYITITDRGPNTEPAFFKGTEKRPFLLPSFNPEIIFLEANPSTSVLQITKRFPLLSPQGKPITGLPNTNKDEWPSDGKGQDLPTSLEGLDIEGLTRDELGNFWVCEEYRPSILKISPDGRILKRWIPKNSFRPEELQALRKIWGQENVLDTLPEIFGKRRENRGFEGITFHHGKVVAALQSPLSLNGTEIPWLVFDPKTELSEVYWYHLENKAVDKIGDIASKGNDILVIEQNSEKGKKAIKKIFAVSGFEKMDGKNHENILNKKLLINLGKLPDFDKYFDHEKLEGLAVISPEMLALIHDNDFGFTGVLSKKQGIAETKKDVSINLMHLWMDPK
jgi:hypothetical protein